MNWEQLQAILWLRWRLTQNQFARAGSLNAVLSVFMLALLLLGALAAGLGGFLAGLFGLAKVPPSVLLLVWDGVLFAFLMLWLTSLMVELQRSESIDLARLLHLPITLEQVFLFNYLASHATPSLVLFLPGMLGLCAGLNLSSGFGMILLIPLVLSFVFLLTAWTYCLRGWLAALMVNKRRRRAIIVWITILFVLVFQIPNVAFNSSWFHKKTAPTPQSANSPATAPATGKREGLMPPQFLQAHLAFPPGWIGYGAMTLKQHNPWPALGATAVSLFLGALGLKRAYRLTLRFYQGAEDQAQSQPTPRVPANRRRPLLVERRLPWLPDDTAALTLATLRSLLRAPELKMALILPIIAGAVLSSTRFALPKGISAQHLSPFIATLVIFVATFSLAPTMANVFGLDRNGFRALVLLPTRRHHILLAKNLAFLPLVGSVAVVLLGIVTVLVRLPWSGFLAGMLQVPLAFLLISLVCNLVAILTPYRLAQGSLQAKKPKPVVFLAVFLTMLGLPLVLAPTLIPPGLQALFSWQGWLPWLPVNLLATLLLLIAVGALYWLLLPLQGRLLQRREQAILREVTEEVE